MDAVFPLLKLNSVSFLVPNMIIFSEKNCDLSSISPFNRSKSNHPYYLVPPFKLTERKRKRKSEEQRTNCIFFCKKKKLRKNITFINLQVDNAVRVFVFIRWNGYLHFYFSTWPYRNRLRNGFFIRVRKKKEIKNVDKKSNPADAN